MKFKDIPVEEVKKKFEILVKNWDALTYDELVEKLDMKKEHVWYMAYTLRTKGIQLKKKKRKKYMSDEFVASLRKFYH